MPRRMETFVDVCEWLWRAGLSSAYLAGWVALRSVAADNKVTWLILPVVICLSQRLSHACLSINNFILWNCERLIISAIIYLMVPYYMDNCSNSRANTCVKSRLFRGGMYLLDKKPMRALSGFVVNHSNFSNGMTSRRPYFIQISALSAFDGSVVDYRGING
jgi:hypothetical protein